jgi:hypothetical protein
MQDFAAYLEGKELLRKHRHRRNYATKMRSKKVGWGSMDWINLVQDRANRGLFYT